MFPREKRIWSRVSSCVLMQTFRDELDREYMLRTVGLLLG